MNIKTYFITGATGYIGSLLIRKLLEDTENHKIYAGIRNMQKACDMYRNTNGVTFVECHLTNTHCLTEIMKQLPDKIDYIIHCAAATDSVGMISHPVETADGIIFGTRTVLELARGLQIKSMVFLSSMEVYGRRDLDDKKTTEEMLGELDILSVRSCYPQGKRMAEQYCYDYYKEYEVPVKIARLSQVFGTGILPGENRVFAQFARAAITGKDIILHTDGTSVGNYVDSKDAVEALLLLLESGRDGEAYNVVNEANTMQIREMAQLVAKSIAGDRIKVVYDIPKSDVFGYAGKTGVRLSSEKIRGLGWKPTANMEEMYRKMITWFE